MITVDANLHDRRIIKAISTWYSGRVVSVVTLRPGTVIKDEAIPALLLKARQPTFVTINVTEFWRKVRPHRACCIVAIALPRERTREVPDLLRRLFRLPAFQTKASRMGKVIRPALDRIEFYESDWRVQSLPWPD
jgi:hypothetical protein